MTTVSVLVPVHDQAAFLGRALADLRDQQLRDWEAVSLDDGSTGAPAIAGPSARSWRATTSGG